MILETLYILFKSDTKDLKKGSQDALESTNKLNESLSSINNSTEQLGSSFIGIAQSLLGIVTSFASIHAIISSLSKTVHYDIDLGKTSRALGVNATQLDAWDGAIRQAGGSAEEFQNSLKSLAEHFHTTPAVALKLLPQVADVMSRISRYSAFTWGKSMGLNESTILLLRRGRRELEGMLDQQKELGLISVHNIEITTKYYQSLDNLEHSVRTLGNSVIDQLLPYFTGFFDVLTKGFKFLASHSDLIIGLLAGVSGAAISAAIAFLPLSTEVVSMATAVIVLIGLFALLYEDIQTYFKGGNSITGLFINKLKEIAHWVKTIIDLFGGFETLLNSFSPGTDLFEKLKDYFNQDKFSSIDLQYGKKQLGLAANNPFNSLSTNTVFNRSAFERNVDINMGPITINTQANDAVGIAAEFGKRTIDYHRQALNNFSDNIHA